MGLGIQVWIRTACEHKQWAGAAEQSVQIYLPRGEEKQQSFCNGENFNNRLSASNDAKVSFSMISRIYIV